MAGGELIITIMIITLFFLLSSRNTVCFSSLNAWCFKYQIKMLTLLQVKVQVQVLSALTLLIIIKCILENQPDGKSRMIVLFSGAPNDNFRKISVRKTI